MGTLFSHLVIYRCHRDGLRHLPVGGIKDQLRRVRAHLGIGQQRHRHRTRRFARQHDAIHSRCAAFRRTKRQRIHYHARCVVVCNRHYDIQGAFAGPVPVIVGVKAPDCVHDAPGVWVRLRHVVVKRCDGHHLGCGPVARVEGEGHGRGLELGIRQQQHGD